ncbi:hypothetical protein FACS1894139_14010 [Planctomycetales bacterium]|nr:hypothetical protein FACS1894108_14870 [Planctomycetales bacterium]GHT06946.1 hypothetical protein FACS1894139_14010 [Planctomycetales bacterium]
MDKYQRFYTNAFKKELRLMQKRGKDLSLIKNVIDTLAQGERLASPHKDHALKGDYSGFCECHITSDWLLIYRIVEERLELVLSRTGSHSDLF